MKQLILNFILISIAFGLQGCGPAQLIQNETISQAESAPTGEMAPPPANPEAILICADVKVDITGKTDASAGLNKCLDQAPSGGSVELPPGIYRLDSTVRIKRSDVRLTTQGLQTSTLGCQAAQGPKCAILKANGTFYDPALLQIEINAENVQIDHITVDGNRDERLPVLDASRVKLNSMKDQLSDVDKKNLLALSCDSMRGRNLHVLQGNRTRIQYSAFLNALCQTNVAWNFSGVAAKESVFVNNVIKNSGDAWELGRKAPADGFTGGLFESLEFSNNTIIDSTDVGVILGTVLKGQIANNNIIQATKNANAGLMLTNWTVYDATPRPASFAQAFFRNNRIQCGGLCDIGLQVGVAPWARSYDNSQLYTVTGATFENNVIASDHQGINVTVAGVAAAPITFVNNQVISLLGQSSAYNPIHWSGTPALESIFNVDRQSTVTITSGVIPVTHVDWLGYF